MSLVFAAITPHPPMLIPSVGKERIEELTKTKEAMQLLERELYTTKPQRIIVISPHSSLYPDSFTINAHTNFESSFETFGDLTTRKEWIGCPDIGSKITHAAKMEHIPVQAMSEKKLDHGASVPLSYLTEHLPDVKILPIGFSGLDPQEHLRFGQLLKEVIMSSEKRVAVIASGDLSHSLTTMSPAGLNANGKKFDTSLCSALAKNDWEHIVNMDQTMIAEAEECGYRSILVLLGIIKDMDYTFTQYSYEHPFGIGYLVGECIF